MGLSTTHAQMYEDNLSTTENTIIASENTIDIYDAKINEFMNIFSTKVNQKWWGSTEIKAFVKQLNAMTNKRPEYKDYITAISSRINLDYQWLLGASNISNDPMLADFVSVLNEVKVQGLTKDETVDSLVNNITNRLNGVPNTEYAIKNISTFLTNYSDLTTTSTTTKEAIPEVIKQLKDLVNNKNEVNDINNQLNNVNIRAPYYNQTSVTKLTKPEFTTDMGYTVNFATSYVSPKSIGADAESEFLMRGPNSKTIDLKTVLDNNPEKYTIAVVVVSIKNNSTKDINYPDNIQLTVKDSKNLLHNTMNIRTNVPPVLFEAGDSYGFKRYFLLDKGARLNRIVITSNDMSGKAYSYTNK